MSRRKEEKREYLLLRHLPYRNEKKRTMGERVHMLPESKDYKLYLTIYIKVYIRTYYDIFNSWSKSLMFFEDSTIYMINCKLVKDVSFLHIGFLSNQFLSLFVNVIRYITHRRCIIVIRVNKRCFYRNERWKVSSEIILRYDYLHLKN